MIVYFGADHRGFHLKNKLKHFVVGLGYHVVDLGDTIYDKFDDYPDFAAAVARKVSEHPEQSRGIVICGSGVGVDVVANKFPGVRSVLAISADQVAHARKTDDVNVLSLEADFVRELEAQNEIHSFLETEFLKDEKYVRRLEKIKRIELEVSHGGRARARVDHAKVIPVINCADIACVRSKVSSAQKFSDWVHLDIADGHFTFNKTWRDPEGWKRLGSKINLEVHLMVHHSEQLTAAWLDAGAKRVIVHFETIHRASSRNILALGAEYGADIMLSSNPNTPIEDLSFYLPKFSSYQVLAVHPGLEGQVFSRAVLEKIKFLRREFPNATIEVDGGMNEETAGLARAAGADVFVAASFIFKEKNPEEAYQKLMSAVQ